MSQFSELKIYWEKWSGYAGRSDPFGMPSLFWIVASHQSAARCAIAASPQGAMQVAWSAEWKSIPYAWVEPFHSLLEEIGAFSNLRPLVSDSADGPYLSVWDLTGVLHGRPFHFSLQFTCPGEQWTPLGLRLAEALRRLETTV